MSLNTTSIIFVALVISVLFCLPLYYIKIAANLNPKISDLSPAQAQVKEMAELRYSRCLRREAPSSLAWILHFNYEPHPEALKTLLCHYADNFRLVVIVSPTGRIGQLLTLDPANYTKSEVIWAEQCPNKVHGFVAWLMMRCYATGLEILVKSSIFDAVDYVVLSNDDVILNMTKVGEFAAVGHGVSHASANDDGPPIFAPPPPNGSYFPGWQHASKWAECQERFSKVPPEYKVRFGERRGERAFCGRVDAVFLPKKSVAEFIFLSSVVGNCWMELGIANSLAMLSEPIKFDALPSEVLMYSGGGAFVDPPTFQRKLKNRSIVSFHPFKLSLPKHRVAFSNFMTKYRLN